MQLATIPMSYPSAGRCYEDRGAGYVYPAIFAVCFLCFAFVFNGCHSRAQGADVRLTIDGQQVYPVPVAQPATVPATLPAPAPASQPATIPVVTPVPQPATQPLLLPAMTYRIAPATGLRGDGYRIAASQTAAGSFCADGWEQNIVVLDHPLPTTLADFWSFRAHHPLPDVPGTYKGQLVYADNCGPLTISGYYGRTAGKWPAMPPAELTRFCHCIYSNFGVASLTVEDAWLDDAACAGIQSRGLVTAIRRCFISECGIGLLLTAGATVEDCTIWGGGTYYFPPDAANKKPASFAGDVAILNYWPVKLKNVWIVGKPGQGTRPTPIAGLKSYHLGAVVSGGDYSKDEWHPPLLADGKTRNKNLVSAVDCVIAGWPGPAFAGDAKHNGAGFTIKPSGVDVTAQVEAIRALMESRQISTAEAVSRAQAAVRGGVK